MADKSIGIMMAEIRQLNTDKGWRSQNKTFEDCIALLHTEAAEMTEAWRRWGLADQTPPQHPRVLPGGELDSLVPGRDYEVPKPEGVGSEIADVLIRTLDLADIIGILPFASDTPKHGLVLAEITRWDMRTVINRNRIPGPLVSFGGHVTWLHREIDRVWTDPMEVDSVLRTIAFIADKFEFDLMAEYDRKMIHNWTRGFRHGGKLL